MNYPPPDELHDYRFVGNDFREREDIKLKEQTIINKFEKLSPVARNRIFRKLSGKI